MHYSFVVSLCFVFIAFAEDFLSTDPLSDDSPMLWDDLDTTANLDVTDPSFLADATSDSGPNQPSCLGENTDSLLWSQARARVRGRDSKSSCSASDQPPPSEDIPDWVTDLGQSSGGHILPEDNIDSAAVLIDNMKCQPMFPYNLCCNQRESFISEIYMAVEIAYYHRCLSRA